MIARESEQCHWLDCWLTIHGHNTLSDATYGQNSRLRLINDCIEGIYPIHAQVANSESTAAYILWPQFPCLRFRHQFLAPLGNFAQAELVCLVNNRNNQPLLYGYR